MKYKYFVLLFMFSIVSTFAQYNVNINVTDAATMLDIDTADVTFDGTTLQTDVNGDVTFTDFSDGMYNYTISKSCYQSITGSLTVSGADVNESYALNAQTSASVFLSTSNHPIIGSWVDGSINLNDGVNNYDYDVTEFDNIVANVVFGTYNYTFSRLGACDTTGTITVDCSTIDPMSGNVFLPIYSEDATTASVFVSTSNHPIIGSWVDGSINLNDGVNNYDYDVTEFDNIVANVVFGTYNYTFSRLGACDTTGTITVDCSTIDPMSGNVFLPIYSEDATTASVFVSTSNHPIIGSWVDGSINLNDGVNNYDYDVTEFDNIVANVVFGTYNYTFSRLGACDTTGTITVDCSTIDPMSGNVFLPIYSEDATIDVSVTQNNEMLNANASGIDITYQWVDCDNGNAPIDGETSQMYTASTNGNYAVIVTNSNCSIADISACYSVNTLSVETVENLFSINVYPNPVVNSVNITLGNTYQNVNAQIYSITGQLINNVNKINSVNFDIDMSNLPSGNYILKINADGNIKSSILIKK